MIRPTFYGFETAKRALNASQAGLDTAGHNVANVNTNGYTRQRVDQVSVGSTVSQKYQVYNQGGRMAGGGTKTTGISQIRNSYLDTRYRNEACTYGELAIKSSAMTDLEAIFDEMTSKGLSDKLSDFITALTTYQTSPDSTEYATTVRAAAQAMVQLLNKNASEIEAVLDQQKYDLDVAITYDINNTLEQIANLNEKIRVANMYGDPANELTDTRNMLIDQLSEYLPIKVVNTPEKISDSLTISRVSIVMTDYSTSPAGEITLVDNEKYSTLNMTENQDGTISIGLVEVETGVVIQDLTHSMSSGAVKGYLDMINGYGDFAGLEDNSFRGIPYYREMLNTFAREFAELMNTLNSISADEAAGKEYVFEHTSKNLFVSYDGGDITAANIRISEMWKNEPSYLTTSKDDPRYELAKDENGNTLYDDDQNEVWENTLLNSNLLKMTEQLQSKSNYFHGTDRDGNRFVVYKGSFEEAVGNIQSTLALDKQLNDSLLDASYEVIDTYATQRSSISAVSIDEEAVSMMTYQNYYNAAARFMTVLDEALGTIIQGMGVVGR